jgi:hypothetical protein
MTDNSILGMARELGDRAGSQLDIPAVEPISRDVSTPTRLSCPALHKPRTAPDRITAQAREICATVSLAGTEIQRRCAPHYLEGCYDDDFEMRVAKAALNSVSRETL